MPVLSPNTPWPYDTATAILNTVRTRMNDELPTLYPVSGKVLDNNQPFVQQCFNTGFRRFQEDLANMGYIRLTQETIIFGFPAVASQDPSSQCFINWSNAFDGVNFFTAPVLPSDFMFPLKVFERWGDQNNCNFSEMECILDGLPTRQKWSCNRMWEWRADSIYFPGSMRVTDFRIRYATYIPDLIDISNARWYTQRVEIVRCLDSLAWYVCSEIVTDPDLKATFTQRGELAAKLVFNRDVRMKQRVNVRRQPRSGRTNNYGVNSLY